MFLSQQVIIGIMRRCYLQCSRTNIHRYIFLSNNGNAAVDQRNKSKLPLQVFISLIIRMNKNGGITHDGLGTDGGDGDEVDG